MYTSTVRFKLIEIFLRIFLQKRYFLQNSKIGSLIDNLTDQKLILNTNQRNDFIHKCSTKLINENQVIAVEDLNIKGMLKNHKLAKSISSVAWSKFFETLEYKAEWYGRKVIKVPTMYPSSQTCSKCGYKNTLVKNLSVREWECPCCHARHDRDLNASVNILNKGLSVA